MGRRGRPCSGAFHDHRLELHSLTFTLLGCVKMSGFDLCRGIGRGTSCAACLAQAFRPLRRCNSDVKCSRNAGQARHKNFRRATPVETGIFGALRQQQAKLLPLKLHACLLSPSANNVSDSMATQVRSPPAEHIPACREGVKNAVALRAPRVFSSVRYPESVAEGMLLHQALLQTGAMRDQSRLKS